MNTNKNNKDVDINEVAITLEVDDEVIEKVRTGEVTHICLHINDDNYRQILENADGHLLLVVDTMPEKFHGCYLYNKGEFPYAIKGILEFLLLKGGDNSCFTKIIGIDTVAGTRFRFQGPGEPSVEDPNGDSCIWEVQFEVVPVPAEPRHYLMRWNPSISSFTEQDFNECLSNMVHGMFRINWSISDWQEARRGDFFYMLREGDDKAGIVFNGQFVSDPYPADDWAGSAKRRMYVDLVCQIIGDPKETPFISMEQLKKHIPTFNWEKGHSGEMLSEDVSEKIADLLP